MSCSFLSNKYFWYRIKIVFSLILFIFAIHGKCTQSFKCNFYIDLKFLFLVRFSLSWMDIKERLMANFIHKILKYHRWFHFVHDLAKRRYSTISYQPHNEFISAIIRIEEVKSDSGGSLKQSALIRPQLCEGNYAQSIFSSL